MTSVGRQAKTLLIDVAVMVFAGFAPALVLVVLGWDSGLNTALLSALAIFIACMSGNGWRTGWNVAVPFAVLVGLAQWTAPNPWLAAIVLASAAFLRGYAAKVGLHDALIMTVIALGFLVASPAPADTTIPSVVFVGLVALASALWATLVVFVLRHRLPKHQHTGLNPIRVLAYSSILALLVGVATWFVVDLDLGHTGGWIILTILVVFQPSLGAGFRKAAERAGGTVLGFVIAIVLGLLLPGGWVLPAAGTVFLMGSFVLMLQGRPYWIYAAVLTPGIVLLESIGSTVDKVAEERLAATLIGITGTVLVMLVLAPLARYLSVKGTAGGTTAAASR